MTIVCKTMLEQYSYSHQSPWKDWMESDNVVNLHKYLLNLCHALKQNLDLNKNITRFNVSLLSLVNN